MRSASLQTPANASPSPIAGFAGARFCAKFSTRRVLTLHKTHTLNNSLIVTDSVSIGRGNDGVMEMLHVMFSSYNGLSELEKFFILFL